MRVEIAIRTPQVADKIMTVNHSFASKLLILKVSETSRSGSFA